MKSKRFGISKDRSGLSIRQMTRGITAPFQNWPLNLIGGGVTGAGSTYNLVSANGSFVLSGQDATLTYTPSVGGPSGDAYLLETGSDYFLLETGDFMLLE